MKKLILVFGCFLFFSSILNAQQSITIEAATTQLENIVNNLLPGGLIVSDVSSNGTDANCVVKGTVPLNGGLNVFLTATFVAGSDNSNVEVVGTASDVTISKLITALGGNASSLPYRFSISDIGDITLTLSPNENKIIGELKDSPIGIVEFERTEDALQVGVSPNNLATLTGINGISLDGFKLVYFSPNQTDPAQEENAKTSLLSLPEVPVVHGLNAYWTGHLPAPLTNLLGFIPGIGNEMTFSGPINIVDGAPEIPSLSFPIPGEFNEKGIKFNNIQFNLEPKSTSVGLSGEITANFGETLVFESSLMTSVANANLTGRISLLQVGDNEPGKWDKPFGIPGVKITDLYVGTNSAGLFLGGAAELGTRDGKEIPMEIEIGNSQLTASADEVSIAGFVGAFVEVPALSDLPEISIKNAIVEVNTSTKVMSLNGEGKVFGINPIIKLTASNIIDVQNSSYEFEGSVDIEKINDFKKDLIEEVKGEIPSYLSIFQLSNLMDDLLGIEVDKLGFSASIKPGDTQFKMGVDFESNIVDFEQDITLDDDLLEEIGGAVLDELVEGLDDLWEGIVEAGETALSISANLVELALNPEGWHEAASDPIGTLENAAGSTTVSLPQPINGSTTFFAPAGTEHYRVTLKSFKTIALGDDGGSGNNNSLEINGEINISSSGTFFNKGANSLLFYKLIPDVECPKGEVVQIGITKDIFLPASNTDIVAFNINLREREGGIDLGDPFGPITFTINRTGLGHTAPSNIGESKSYTKRLSVSGQVLDVTFELKKMPVNVGKFHIIAQQGMDGGKNYLKASGTNSTLVNKVGNMNGTIWHLVKQEDNLYRIKNMEGLPLGCNGDEITLKLNLINKWILVPLEDKGYYRIKSINGKYLSTSATGLSLVSKNENSLRQRWYLGSKGFSCYDGVQNQGEIAIDCGGPNCEPCGPQFGEADYKVVSKATGKVLDLNQTNGNVAQYSFHGEDNQLWNFEYINGTGYVKIVSKATGKVLDLNQANGNVTQYSFHGGDNQLWKIETCEETDYLKVVSKATGKVLNLNQVNGNVSEYNFQGMDNQLWKIESVSNATLGGENKLYTIQQKSNNRFMDAHESSGNDYSIVTRPAQNNRTQEWIILPLGNDIYTIQQKSNNRFMDAHESSGNDYSIVTRPAQNDSSQEWIILPLGNDTYTIQQKSNNRFMDAHEGSGNDYSVVTRPAQNDSSQQWIIKLK